MSVIWWNEDDISDVERGIGRQIDGVPPGDDPDRRYFVDYDRRSRKWRPTWTREDHFQLHKIGHRLWPTYQDAMAACEEHERTLSD